MTRASRPVAEALFVELLKSHAEFQARQHEHDCALARTVMTLPEGDIQGVARVAWMTAEIFEELAR